MSSRNVVNPDYSMLIRQAISDVSGRQKSSDAEQQRSDISDRRAALQIPVSQFRVNLSLNGGKTTPVNVSSRDDVTAINGFMRELEAAAKRSFS